MTRSGLGTQDAWRSQSRSPHIPVLPPLLSAPTPERESVTRSGLGSQEARLNEPRRARGPTFPPFTAAPPPSA